MDKSDLEHVEAGEVNKYELSPAELIATSEHHTARSPVERRLVWKADLAILPIISAAYLVSYLVSGFSSLSDRRVLTCLPPRIETASVTLASWVFPKTFT